MPHFITMIAMSYLVAAVVYSVYDPKEDCALFIGILVFIVPLVILAIAVDKFWK